MTTTSITQITPEDLLRLPDAVNYELVDGKLVERNMGYESSEIAIRIAILLGVYLQKNPIGHLAGSEAGFQCFPDAPDKVRRPDLSFVRLGRFPGEKSPKGHCRIPPDLVIEVVSPGDLASEVDEKVAEYLTAGVPLIWVVHPNTKTVQIYRPATSPQGPGPRLTESDTIAGEDILPDFSARVSAFFK